MCLHTLINLMCMLPQLHGISMQHLRSHPQRTSDI